MDTNLSADNRNVVNAIVGEEYNVAQLRQWCGQLGLARSGKKAALILRLNAIPPVERGVCPEIIRPAEASASEDDTSSDAEFASEAASVQPVDVSRELQLLKRERELLKRENELLKRELRLNKQSQTPVVDLDVHQNAPFSLIKDLVPEFNESCNYDLWAKQVRSVVDIYKPCENIMRAVVISKLKGKVLDWLHGNIDCAGYSIDELLARIKVGFGSKESKLMLRQRFEARKWSFEEPFANYYNDKNILASQLDLDEDELLDHIIEGIPEQQLKIQAFMQCFKRKDDLLQAFSKIRLSRNKKATQQQQQLVVNKAETRCFNCNSLGHWKTECRKPKREPGTCFGCGKTEHQIHDCPERKRTIANIELNNYVSLVEFSYNIENKTLVFNLESLIDTGSPVSIIKKKCVPCAVEYNFSYFNNYKERLYGINKSLLQIYGKISCTVNFENQKVLMNLAVVPDDTMSYDAILGRDFLSKIDAKLVVRSKISNNLEQKTDCKTLKNFSKNLELDIETMLENESEILEKNMNLDIMNINITEDEEMNVNIGDAVSWHFKERFKKLFREDYCRPDRPETPNIKCEIRLTLNNEKPFSCRPRRISYAEKEELQKIINENLEKGYIRPSNSEYASAIVLVRKKNNELRMCVDFRNLNKITAKDNYPIPLIDEQLEKLAKKRIFTKLDLKNGFYHVFVHPDSVKYTSFVTPLGQFEFLRMAFGLKNAPAVFQRFINSIFLDMIQSEQVIVYLDDIMIAIHSCTVLLRICIYLCHVN